MGGSNGRRGVGGSSRSSRAALMAFGLSVPLDAFRTTPSPFTSSRVKESAERGHHRRRRQLRFQSNSVVLSSADTFYDVTKKTQTTTSAVGEVQTNTKENTSKINGVGGEPDAPFVGLPSYKRILTFVSTTFLM